MKTGNPELTYQPRTILFYEDLSPSVGHVMSQGAVVGACAYFLLVIFKLIFYPHGYDFFFGVYMPLILGYGAGTGLLTAIAIWALMKIFDRPLGWFARIIVATIVVLFISHVFNAVFDTPNTTHPELIPVTIFVAVLLSVVVGSQAQPGSWLIQGLTPLKGQQVWLVAIVGFPFRILTLLGLMGSLFASALTLRDYFQSQDTLLALLILGYFLANTAVALTNARSLLMVSLGVLVNAPWIFVLVQFFDGLGYASYLIVAYLALLFVFLLTHWPRTKLLFSSIRKELRYYYLID